MNISLQNLHDCWLDALWEEYHEAYRRGHMDASDIPEPKLIAIESAGVDAYLSNLYLGTKRKTWMDKPVDKLSRHTERVARDLVRIRDTRANGGAA